MTLFAVRRSLETLPGVEALQQAAETVPAARWLRSYWTPEDHLLFSVHEGGEGRVSPGETGVQAVVELRPEEYVPLVESPAPLNDEGRQGRDDLPLVLVRRWVERATREEFDAMAMRAVMCALEYRDLVWLRSYWAPEQQQTTCIFRTAAHDLVREHAERSRLPCNEIHDAIEILPGEMARPR